MSEDANIIAAVRAAFDRTVRPDYTIADAEEDGGALEGPCIDERHWSDLRPDCIERMTSAFCYMPPQSVPYYLAAYVTMVLEDASRRRPGSPDDIEMFLTSREMARPVLELLDEEQARAVARFVSCMAALDHQRLRDDGFHEPELRELNYYRRASETFWDEYL